MRFRVPYPGQMTQVDNERVVQYQEFKVFAMCLGLGVKWRSLLLFDLWHIDFIPTKQDDVLVLVFLPPFTYKTILPSKSCGNRFEIPVNRLNCLLVEINRLSCENRIHLQDIILASSSIFILPKNNNITIMILIFIIYI